ncbi:hypothetical protein [Zooshikella harenae]|uniref:Uncharacterized protein n=1 Tax=Zooshikella harenae TaxID=2827238 RepID=A0ABS5ZK17_9GAMM|nr:hypothetical protein [Zooshikella harenae]MBU2714429.1 hypothetical protein [Zooshikella harenae]
MSIVRTCIVLILTLLLSDLFVFFIGGGDILVSLNIFTLTASYLTVGLIFIYLFLNYINNPSILLIMTVSLLTYSYIIIKAGDSKVNMAKVFLKHSFYSPIVFFKLNNTTKKEAKKMLKDPILFSVDFTNKRYIFCQGIKDNEKYEVIKADLYLKDYPELILEKITLKPNTDKTVLLKCVDS